MLCCSEVGKLSQVQNGTPPTTNYNGVDAVHACNILQQLKALYDEAQLTDIVVEVDHGKTFSCHRNVLAAISPYFRYELYNCLYLNNSVSENIKTSLDFGVNTDLLTKCYKTQIIYLLVKF